MRYKKIWTMLWEGISDLLCWKDVNWTDVLEVCSILLCLGIFIAFMIMVLGGGYDILWTGAMGIAGIFCGFLSLLILSRDDIKAYSLTAAAKIRATLNNFRILLLLWLIIRALTTRPRVKQAPGTKLLSIVEFFYSPKTVEEVFKPVIADWRTEYFEALKHNRTIKAHWISVRYKYHFVVAMGVSKVYSLFRSILSARK